VICGSKVCRNKTRGKEMPSERKWELYPKVVLYIHFNQHVRVFTCIYLIICTRYSVVHVRVCNGPLNDEVEDTRGRNTTHYFSVDILFCFIS